MACARAQGEAGASAEASFSREPSQRNKASARRELFALDCPWSINLAKAYPFANNSLEALS
jgi:hypothetical protein